MQRLGKRPYTSLALAVRLIKFCGCVLARLPTLDALMSDSPYASRASTLADSPSQTATRGSLLVIFLTIFIDLLGFGMVLPLLPVYGRQLAAQHHWSPEQTGWMLGLLMSSFSVMQFLFAPMWGRLSDRVGRRPILMLGLAGSVVFYTLFGIATVLGSVLWLFIARIGAGMAGATISTAHAYIADSTSLENRTKGMALVGAAFGLGFTFGPLLGALAMLASDPDHLSPMPGYLASALSACALGLASFLLPESLRPDGQHKARRLFDFESLRTALATPSVGLLLLASFISVLAFANFESTVSLLVKNEAGPFQFSFQQVMYTFAYIGLMLTLIQGGLVRRLSGRVPEGAMATLGAVSSIAGSLLLAWTAYTGSMLMLFVALAVQVNGFAFLTPSLNALISRRSDPAKQGGILGVGQSVSSLARIAGPVVGLRLFPVHPACPLYLAAGLMVIGLVVVLVGARSGQDFQ